MFILSQDKKKFAEYKFFEASENYRGKKESKSFLLGIDCRGIAGRTIVLGSYSGEEEATSEPENIYTAMKNSEAVYAVKWGSFMKENINNALDTNDEEKDLNVASQASTFSFEEKKAYFKKKWRKEHILLYAILFLILTVSIVLPFVFDRPYFLGLAPLIAFVEYGYQNNKMMIYVEKNLYD